MNLKYDKNDLIQIGKDFYDKEKRPPCKRDLSQFDTIYRNFENWDNYLKACGIDRDKIRKREIIKALAKAYCKNGGRLTNMQIIKDDDLPGIKQIFSAFRTYKMSQVWYIVEKYMERMD